MLGTGHREMNRAARRALVGGVRTLAGSGLARMLALFLLMVLATPNPSRSATPSWPATNRRAANDILDCWNLHGAWAHSVKALSVTDHSCNLQSPAAQNECVLLSNNGSGLHHSHYHYHWHVERGKCAVPFYPWSAEVACALLQDQHVVMVGDATQEDFYASFLSAFSKHGVAEDCGSSSSSSIAQARTVHCFGVAGAGAGGDGGDGGGGGSFRVRFLRTDPPPPPPQQQPGQHPSWLAELDKEAPSVLILPPGAGLANLSNPNSNLNPNSNSNNVAPVDQLRALMRHLKSAHPATLIIARSAHLSHSNHASLFNAPPLEFIGPPMDLNDIILYAKTTQANNRTRALLLAEHPEAIYMDVLPSTALRADAHLFKDPIAYCTPGPMDHWVRTLVNTLALLKTSDKTTESYTLEKQRADPILEQWRDFRGATGQARCGAGGAEGLAWMDSYKALHRAHVAAASQDDFLKQAAGGPGPAPSAAEAAAPNSSAASSVSGDPNPNPNPDPNPPRLFVSTSSGQGATDRLVGHLTGFFAALLSRRAFVLDSTNGALTFDAAFDYPEIDLKLPGALRKSVDEAWNHPGARTIYADERSKFGIVHYHDGFPIFTEKYPPEAYPIIFGPKPVLILSSNRGNIYNLLHRSNYSHVFSSQPYKLTPRYGAYCAFHYLFRPNIETLSLAQPYSSQLGGDTVKVRSIKANTCRPSVQLYAFASMIYTHTSVDAFIHSSFKKCADY